MEYWHIVPINDGYHYVCTDENGNHFLGEKGQKLMVGQKIFFDCQGDAQRYIDQHLNEDYKPEKYLIFNKNDK